MANEQIQDDVLRRALDYFGLRGTIPHEYVSAVLPTISVGNLRNPEIHKAMVPNIIAGAAAFFPFGETWHPIFWSGNLIQAAGAVAPIWECQAFAGSSGNTRMSLPSWVNQDVEVIAHPMTLNSTVRFAVRFPIDFLLGPGMTLTWDTNAGDGNRTIGNSILVYERFGETLASLQ
jgi:hypothetical protein